MVRLQFLTFSKQKQCRLKPQTLPLSTTLRKPPNSSGGLSQASSNSSRLFEDSKIPVRTYAILVEIKGFSTCRLMESWRKLDAPNFHSNFHSSLQSNRRRNRPKPKPDMGLSPFAKTNNFRFCYENCEIILFCAEALIVFVRVGQSAVASAFRFLLGVLD